jgi:copper chaperone CopZ
MNTIEIKTTGTYCSSCSMLIEMDVSDLPGVSEVRSSYADGVTTVLYDTSTIDAEAIAEVIRKAGYGAEIQG